MGQIRKTKVQIANECREIYKLRKAGNSYEFIADKLKIDLRNFFKTYLPRLKEMCIDEMPTIFDEGELAIQHKIFQERLELWIAMCVGKAAADGASAEWMKTAISAQVLLNRFRREGFTAFNNNEFNRITQRMGEMDEGSEPTHVLPPATESTEDNQV